MTASTMCMKWHLPRDTFLEMARLNVEMYFVCCKHYPHLHERICSCHTVGKIWREKSPLCKLKTTLFSFYILVCSFLWLFIVPCHLSMLFAQSCQKKKTVSLYALIHLLSISMFPSGSPSLPRKKVGERRLLNSIECLNFGRGHCSRSIFRNFKLQTWILEFLFLWYRLASSFLVRFWVYAWRSPSRILKTTTGSLLRYYHGVFGFTVDF